MPSNPEQCECGSQLFVPIWAVEPKTGEPTTDFDPADGDTRKSRVGFYCIECECLQLTREIPRPHAENDDLSLPDAAERDVVRE